MNRRRLLCAITSTAALVQVKTIAAQTTSATAVVKNKTTPASAALSLSLISKGASLRTLPLRISKAYAQIGLGIFSLRAGAVLSKSMIQFDETVKTLIALAPTPNIKKNYAELGQVWSRFKPMFQNIPNFEEALHVQARAELLAKLADDALEVLDNFVGTNAGALINLSAKQHMLSQRLASSVFFKEWLKTNSNSASIKTDEDEFKNGLKNLFEDKETTDIIKADLSLAQTQWIFFQAAIQESLSSVPDRSQLEYIANTSERIFQLFTEITALYEKNALATK
jgi:hypothetical protein